jgi:3-oxoacyl-[acyl-carrier protein] reductase
MFGGRGSEQWKDRSIVVTGGSRGIGLATARAFLKGGARVAICAMDQERLQQARRDLAGLGQVYAAAADVRDPIQVEAFVGRAGEELGPVDVLVNNAGLVWAGSFTEQPYESMGDVIDVNLKGLMYMTRAVLPSMIERASGVIVNVSSGAGLSGFADIVSYCASKFGVVGFTESLDQEVSGRGVRVYGICPGRVATDMQVQYSGQRVGMPPERVAERILELAGSKGRTGKCVTLA